MPENGPSRKRMTLDQIATEADLDTLTVRQLKELLAGYFVNYKGCVEKWELLERVKRLWNEDQVNKEKGKVKTREMCTHNHDNLKLYSIYLTEMMFIEHTRDHKKVVTIFIHSWSLYTGTFAPNLTSWD